MSGAQPVRIALCCEAYSLAALHAATYRLIGEATCTIERQDTTWVCEITPALKRSKPETLEQDVKQRFMALVTDESLREKVAQKTDGVRNVILALAFGSMASQSGESS